MGSKDEGDEENESARELVEYDRSLRKVVGIPMAAIGSCDPIAVKYAKAEVLSNLIKSHSTVIFTGLESGLLRSY